MNIPLSLNTRYRIFTEWYESIQRNKLRLGNSLNYGIDSLTVHLVFIDVVRHYISPNKILAKQTA